MTAPASARVPPSSSIEVEVRTSISSTPRKLNSSPLTANSTYCQTERPTSHPAAVISREDVERSVSPATRTARTPDAPIRSAAR
jgi:hypothetical protein